MGNDTFAVLKGAPHPVLAHLFLDHLLDVETALAEHGIHRLPAAADRNDAGAGRSKKNWSRKTCTSTILREEQFKQGFLQGPLSAEAMGIWETAWSEVKTT